MLSVGIKAADFTYLGVLGGGSFGLVVLARCAKNYFPYPRKLYALKLVYPRPGISTKYESEFTVLASLGSSDHIVRLWSTFTDEVPSAVLSLDRVPALARAQLQGRSGSPNATLHFAVFDAHPNTLLSWRLKHPAILPFAEWNRVAVQVLGNLLELERLNLLHRDVKPDNFLVTVDGTVCISDFGLAIRLVLDDTCALTPCASW